MTSVSSAAQQTFFGDSLSRGFNSVEFHVINHDPRGNHPPFDGSGAAPFLKRLDGGSWNGSLNYGNIASEAPDFTTPNAIYWNAVDSLVASAGQQGILLLLFPAYVGYAGGDQGFMRELVANGASRIQTYGAFIANRYKNSANIVWMMGGDKGSYDAAQSPVEQALRTGIDSVAGQQSKWFSAEWDSEMIGTDQQSFGPITLNGVYSWSGRVASLARRAYAHAPVEPAFLLEEPYDQEGPDGNGANGSATQPVRRFQWWGFLSTVGGHVAGNGYVWRFVDWQAHLDTQGSRDLSKLNAFIRSIAWHKLVPSGLGGMKTLVTSGGGSPDAADYVSAAATPDGKLLVAYAPPGRQGIFSIDMSAMSASSRARWFNPTTGTYTDISGGQYTFAASGNRAFSPPGNNGSGNSDWVLVLDAATGTSASPSVATAAASSPSPVSGGTTNVSVLGADDGGESSLSYAWSATGPAAVSFTPNGSHAAASAVATFNRAGSYVLRATISDAQGQFVTSDVNVSVNQTFTRLSIAPASATVAPNATQPFTASALDQFGNTLTQQPTTSWAVSGGGTIASNGRFTAGGSVGGPYTVTGSASGKSGTANVTIATTSTVLYRINAGGGANAPFAADQFSSGGNSFSNGHVIVTAGVANAAPAAVYQSERWGNQSYTFTGLTSAAAVLVRLHFAEIFFTRAGARTFNVTINGAAALSNFDIYAAGGADTAVVRDFSAQADSSGRVVIQFTGVTDNAKVSGLELYLGGGGSTGGGSTLIRLNGGGPSVGVFGQDASFSGGNSFTTASAITTIGVTNPAPEAAYQSERFGNFSYDFSGLTAGAAHTVRLHFAEIYFTTTGSRLFDVKINGAAGLSSFDIVAAAGAGNRAVVRELTANADAGGKLSLQFVSVRDSAKVSAIEVLKL